MNKMSIARPYAEALFSIATSTGKIIEIEESLRNICDIISEKDACSLLANSSISVEKKSQIIISILKTKDEIIKNIVKKLISSKRIMASNEILCIYELMKDETENKKTVFVNSASPLTKVQSKKICDNIKGKIKKDIKPVFKTKPDLIGGFTIKVNDKLIDQSVLGLLNQLKSALINHEDNNHAAT